jgi:hypothetical protein
MKCVSDKPLAYINTVTLNTIYYDWMRLVVVYGLWCFTPLSTIFQLYRGGIL